MLVKNKGSTFLFGAMSLTLAALITKVLGVLYKVPLSYLLTDEGMGYFNSAYTVYGLFYIISTAGVPKAVAMLNSELTGATDDNNIYNLYRYVLIRLSLIGLGISILFVLLSPLLSSTIGSVNSVFTMLAVAPTVFFVSSSGVARGYLNSCGKLLPIAISQLIEALSKLVLGITFAYIGARLRLSLHYISALTVLGITLGSLFSSIYLLNIVKLSKPTEKLGQNNINFRKCFFRLVKIAVPITLSSSVLSISGIIDTGIIIRGLDGLYDKVEAISLYGNYTTLAFPMLTLVSSVLSPICVAYLPKLRRSYVKGENLDFSNELYNSLIVVSSFSIACAFAYFFYSFELLDLLFSTESSLVGAEMLMYLSPSVFLLPVLTVFNTALEAMDRLRATLLSITLGSVFKIVLSFILITRTPLGILCAPISTGASYLLSLLISIMLVNTSKIRLRLFKSFVFPLLSAFISFTVVYSFLYLPFGNNYGAISTIICVSISFLFYYVIFICALFISKNAQKKVKFNKNENILLVNR